MWNFLDEAERLRDSPEGKDFANEFNLVFKALSALNQTHSKATLDVINIESVFAAFEMGKLLGRLGTLTPDEINQLPNAMRRVIVRTLEHTIRIPVTPQGQGQAPGDYSGLADLAKRLTQKQPEISKYFSVVTFNYDLCIDLALYYAGLRVKYCLDSESDPQEIPVFKLHGSLNWGRCSGCEKLVAWPLSQYLRTYSWQPFNETGRGRLAMSAHFRDFNHCDKASFESAPYVVPPTWNKSQYHAELESVWKAAAYELSTAENIIVCGHFGFQRLQSVLTRHRSNPRSVEGRMRQAIEKRNIMHRPRAPPGKSAFR